MKIYWDEIEKRYTIDEHGYVVDLNVAKNCGFEFDSGSATWYTPSADVVKNLSNAKLKLRSPLTISELALRHYKEAGQKVLTAVEESRAQDSDLVIPVPLGLALMPFQRAGVAYIIKKFEGSCGVLLSDEMGLGKGPQSIAAANCFPTIRRVLIIVPATLKLNWRKEWLRWDVKGLTVAVAHGTKEPLPVADVIILNYDILKAHRSKLRAKEWDLVIVDECHMLKSRKADRTLEVFGGIKRNPDKTIKERISPIPTKRLLLLTGTPILAKPKDLWPLLQAINPNGLGGDWFSFAKRYCGAQQIVIGGEKTGWWWDGAENLDELQEIMRSQFMIRRLKKDVLKDLPSKTRQIIVIEPDKTALKKLIEKEKKVYDEYGLSETVTDSPAFTEISKVRKEVAIAKAPFVVEYLKEVLSERNKIVVAVHHHEVGDAIAVAFGDAAVSLDGRTPNDARQAAVDRFQTDPTCKLFIGSIFAAGVGITLTAASTVIFAELDWTPALVSQFEDRCHRIGQKEQVLVQHIVLEGSLDERMVEVLIQKQDVIDRALDTAQ